MRSLLVLGLFAAVHASTDLADVYKGLNPGQIRAKIQTKLNDLAPKEQPLVGSKANTNPIRRLPEHVYDLEELREHFHDCPSGTKSLSYEDRVSYIRIRSDLGSLNGLKLSVEIFWRRKVSKMERREIQPNPHLMQFEKLAYNLEQSSGTPDDYYLTDGENNEYYGIVYAGDRIIGRTRALSLGKVVFSDKICLQQFSGAAKVNLLGDALPEIRPCFPAALCGSSPIELKNTDRFIGFPSPLDVQATNRFTMRVYRRLKNTMYESEPFELISPDHQQYVQGNAPLRVVNMDYYKKNCQYVYYGVLESDSYPKKDLGRTVELSMNTGFFRIPDQHMVLEDDLKKLDTLQTCDPEFCRDHVALKVSKQFIQVPVLVGTVGSNRRFLWLYRGAKETEAAPKQNSWWNTGARAKVRRSYRRVFIGKEIMAAWSDDTEEATVVYDYDDGYDYFGVLVELEKQVLAGNPVTTVKEIARTPMLAPDSRAIHFGKSVTGLPVFHHRGPNTACQKGEIQLEFKNWEDKIGYDDQDSCSVKSGRMGSRCVDMKIYLRQKSGEPITLNSKNLMKLDMSNVPRYTVDWKSGEKRNLLQIMKHATYDYVGFIFDRDGVKRGQTEMLSNQKLVEDLKAQSSIYTTCV